MHRRIAALLSAATLLPLSAAVAATTGSSAAASTAQAYTASADATFLNVKAVGLPSLGTLVKLKLADSSAEADSTARKNATAHAVDIKTALGGNLLPIKLKISEASQSAPPPHTRQAFDRLLRVSAAPLLNAAVATTTAFAPGVGPGGCTTKGTISRATASTLDAEALITDIPGVFHGSVVSLPGTVYSASRTSLVKVPGQAGLGVGTTAAVQAAKIVLFGGSPYEIQIKVISSPTLSGIAAGTSRSRVDFKAPILEIAQGGKTLGRLDAPHASLDVNIGLAQVKLSLADLVKSVSPTKVSASAALLHVSVTLLNLVKVLDLNLGELEVDATAPRGGVICPPPTPSPTKPTVPPTGTPTGPPTATPTVPTGPPTATVPGGGGGKGTVPAPGPGGQLGNTGVSNALPLTAVALLLLVGGGTLVFMTRRRSRAMHR
ncbi:MAG TPA: LPXTG cell wall anchor domain-containing protein [Mycobacteriales bacterium]|nr:LPXTG cell wall anchor domain-containing protein [Mycobacteriales bacterium]